MYGTVPQVTQIYWYAPWPDDRPWVSLDLAKHVAGATDEVVLHRLAPASGPEDVVHSRIRVIADLPTASAARPWTPRWFVDRAALVSRRALRRNALVRRLRPDVVHLQLLNRFTDAWLMPGGPVVATVHDVLPHHRRLSVRSEHLLAARVYGRLSAVVVHHPSVADELSTHFGIPRERLHHVPLAIAPNEQRTVARDLTSPVVLFFGAFRKNKGIAELCDAIALVGDDPDVRFRFAGRGDAQLEAMVRTLATRDRRVRADIGYAPDDFKQRLFREASLVVLPYTSFTSQSAVLGDAYAAGTPVLVADAGALGASVREDRTGWVLDSTHPTDIADGLRRALSDASEWRKRSERCSAIALTRSPEKVAHSYRDLYAELVRR